MARVRGNGSGNNGDTNGWWNQAPQYTQGAEVDLNTTGYVGLNNLSFDWYCTSSGVKDLMVQYNTNTTNAAGWTNLLGTPLVATSNDYYGGAGASPTNTVSLSGITLPANDANFGLRLVSAYDPNFPSSTGYSAANSPTTGTQTQITNTGGNWRFDNIQVTGTSAPAPTVSSVSVSPNSVTAGAGTPVSLQAVVTETGGTPSSVSFYREATNGTESAANDTLVPGTATNSSGTWTLSGVSTGSLAAGTYTYYAVATDSSNRTNSGVGAAPTATLTVNGTTPVVTTNPLSQTVSAGTTATFTAAATSGITVQWQYLAPGGTFTNITTTNTPNESGATSTTLTLSNVTEATTGYQYRAVFTNSGNTAPTAAATLTVLGTPIAQWNFGSGLPGEPQGAIIYGNGNSPATTLNNVASANSNPSASAFPLGLTNDYTGIRASRLRTC